MRKLPLVFTLCVTVGFTACLGSGDGNNSRKVTRGGPPGANRPPTIAGSPPPNILESEPYEFTPAASDPDGDILEFTIKQKPPWATFDASSGRVSGTPDADDVGHFSNITVTVSDGRASASLAAFDITVNQIAPGTATLSWNPPTENVDGSWLTNLAGYRIYYGRNPGTLDQSVVLDNPGLTRYVIENLTPARWHFAMTSVNAGGRESKRSATVRKTVS